MLTINKNINATDTKVAKSLITSNTATPVKAVKKKIVKKTIAKDTTPVKAKRKNAAQDIQRSITRKRIEAITDLKEQGFTKEEIVTILSQDPSTAG